MDIVPIKQIKNFESPNNIENNSSLLGKGIYRFCVSGASGGGKTYTVATLIPQLIHQPFYVLVCCKNEQQDVFLSLKKWCKSKNIEYENQTYLHEEKMQWLEHNKYPKLVIIDDFEYQENKEHAKYVINLFQRGRHSYTYICAVTQRLYDLHRTLRINSNCLIVFPVNDSNTTILNTLSSYAPREIVQQGYNYIKQNKYSSMWFFEEQGPVIVDKDLKLINMYNMQQVILPKKKKIRQRKIKKEESEKSSEEESEDQEN